MCAALAVGCDSGGGSTSNVTHDDTAHTDTFTASSVTETPPTTGGDVSTGFTGSITDAANLDLLVMMVAARS